MKGLAAGGRCWIGQGQRIACLALLAFFLGACAVSPQLEDSGGPAYRTPAHPDQPAHMATTPTEPAGAAHAEAPGHNGAAPDAASNDAALGEVAEPSAGAAAEPETSRTRDLGSYLRRVRSASCPDPRTRSEPQSIELTVAPIRLGRFGALRKVGELAYVAGFELDSPDSRFGGVSGLVRLDQRRLLAVTDQGDMLWIDLDETGIRPISARLSPLLDLESSPLTGKATGDAEGLAMLEGLALVSFERDHRVLAFDIAACGASARGAPVANGENETRLSEVLARSGLAVAENAGPEALAVTTDGLLLIGLETQADRAGPVSVRGIEAAPVFNIRIGEGSPDLVGLDVLPSETGNGWRAFSLHRGFSAGIGPTISLNETVLVAAAPFGEPKADAALSSRIGSDRGDADRYRTGESRRLASMNALHNIDNFEGVAVSPKTDGGVRIFIVSDDNFSERQRTLLMVFDLPGAAE